MPSIIELSIRRRPDGGLSADALLTSDASSAPSMLASDAPVPIDEQALLAEVLIPSTYGRLLSAQLFATPALREAWLKARAYAATDALQLRLRLDIAADTLHGLQWEMLCDPETGQPIALDERVRLVRTIDSADLTPLVIPRDPALQALIVVANPANLGSFGLAEVDVDGEVARAREALGDMPATILGDYAAANGRATLEHMTAALRDGARLVILVAHGRLVDGVPVICLEQEDGAADWVAGADFVAAVARLATRPLLLALLSCQSGGRGYDDTLSALGPQLARAGVPAVLGFQGQVAMGTVKLFLPRLIAELRRDGQIDRALAATRAALGERRPWWQALLWLRTDGRLWQDAGAGQVIAETNALPLPRPPGQLSLKGNPFTPGTVAPPERFFGRDETVEAILSGVQSMQSISIVGEARIGKSTLLRLLEARIPEQLAPYGRYRVIYMSMDRVSDPASFYEGLLRALLPLLPPGAGEERTLRALEAALGRGEHPSPERTEQVIGWAVEAGVGVVLLLDEFKDLLEKPDRFDPIFCGWLRSLYTHRQVALVMATRQPLTEIAHAALYFLNGLSITHTLGPLTSSEAEALLRQQHDRPFSPAEVRLGLRAGEQHPFKLQIAGDRLYRWKGQRSSPLHRADGSLRGDAERTLRREVQQAFDQSKRLSSPRPTSRSLWRWLDGLGDAAGRVGAGADAAGNRVLGALIVIALLVILGGGVAVLAGAIDLQTFRELLRALSGGGP